MKKLIKINEQHYVIIDDSEIKINDWFCHILTKDLCIYEESDLDLNEFLFKITHSTLRLQNTEYIALEYVEELFNNTYELFKQIDGSCNENEYEHWLFKQGFKAHKELTKDNLFTISDMIRAMRYASEITNNKLSNIKNYIKSVLPKTEWNVDIINDKIVLL